MASTRCWHCHELAQMVFPHSYSNTVLNFSSEDNRIVFPDPRFSKTSDTDELGNLYVYSCVNCGYPNIAQVKISSIVDAMDDDPENHIVRWLPIEPLGKNYPNVPHAIASAANEVHKCLEIGANRAAMVMARIALEGIVAEQDGFASRKNLYERINDLRISGKITSRTADAATAIRLCGNDYAHNVFEPIDDEYVEITVQILDSLIDDLYSNPTLVERATEYAKQRRATKKETNRENC